MNEPIIKWEETQATIEGLKKHFDTMLELPEGSMKFAGLVLYFTDGEAIIQNRILSDGFDPDEERVC